VGERDPACARDPAHETPYRQTSHASAQKDRVNVTSSGFFNRFANRIARVTGNASSFIVAVSIIAVWAVTGPVFGFSDTWQLAINTSTTIVTFLMVFLIQNTQNRDSAAVQLKLDELIRATAGAHNGLLDLEELSDAEILSMRGRYRDLARRAREGITAGTQDTGTEDVDPRDSIPAVGSRRSR
jgi:low affinity Fe/Cu permease